MKYIEKIPLERIDRIAIVPGNSLPMSQVKGDADFIMNGGLYDFATGKPVGHLKIDGVVHAKENWNYWGYRWDTGPDIRMDIVPDSGGRNYIGDIELLSPGVSATDKITYPASRGGNKPKTGMGMTGDALILYCADDLITPEQVRDDFVAAGAKTAIMLDSGGSSQCDFQGKKINSDRKVHNYIAVWLKKEDDKVKKVVLDPGHGVETAGKRSPDGTYREHEFTLDMAKRIKAILDRHGVAVKLTRETENDVPLVTRVGIANDYNPDLFVSIHSNAAGSGASWMNARGYGVYTSAAGDTAGRNIAARKLIARAVEAGVGLWGDGLHHNISLYVLKNTVAPAVLIEHLFHDNRDDVALLKNSVYRDTLAEVDAKGILDYLGIPWQEKAAEGAAGCVCPWCGGKLKIVKGE